jgi:transposase
VEQETLLQGLFVLIANAPEHSAKEALLAYKRQTAVEQDHHILQGPLGVAPLFLKDPAKITPYG